MKNDLKSVWKVLKENSCPNKQRLLVIMATSESSESKSNKINPVNAGDVINDAFWLKWSIQFRILFWMPTCADA